MKPDIHPEYKELTIVFTDGTEFTTKSTMGGKLLNDVDFRNHQAWTGSTSQLNQKANEVTKFKKKFGDFNFGMEDESNGEK